MNKDKFEYFLNAVHYCLWLGDISFGAFAERIVNKILAPIPKYLFTKEYRKRYYERLHRGQKKADVFFNNKKNGFHIGWAHHLFSDFYSCYSAFIAFIMVGIGDRQLGELNRLLFLIFFGIPIVLLYIPAYRVVFSNDRYLKYFKEFEKKNDRWHKKWKRITVVFCFGGIISAALGFFCMAIITSI